MDLTTNISATRIGMGVESNRKLVGLLWFAGTGKTAHTSIHCVTGRIDPAIDERLPVFEEDGVTRVIREHEEWAVKVCTSCPPPTDEDWKDWAACRGTASAPTEGRQAEIDFAEEYCNNCAVQLECLEYGAAGGNDNAGLVWGGIYFSHDVTGRKKRIAEQRRKIESGVIG